jgi:hypothetical protein
MKDAKLNGTFISCYHPLADSDTVVGRDNVHQNALKVVISLLDDRLHAPLYIFGDIIDWNNQRNAYFSLFSIMDANVVKVSKLHSISA